MKTLHIEITGTTPLLMNQFYDEVAQAATKGTRSSIATDHLEPREAAARKVYKDGKGKPIIPQPNLLRCFIDSGKYFKVGKRQMTTQKTSIIPAAIEMDAVSYLVVSKNGWDVDTRPVRIPATGGRILAHRPCFHDWGLKFDVGLDETIITEKTFRELVDCAGKRIGLGDFRPDTKGPFGKFVVTKWSNGVK